MSSRQNIPKIKKGADLSLGSDGEEKKRDSAFSVPVPVPGAETYDISKGYHFEKTNGTSHIMRNLENVFLNLKFVHERGQANKKVSTEDA